MKSGDELRLDAVRFMLVAPGQEVAATRKLDGVGGGARKPGGNGMLIAIVAAVLVIGVIAIYMLR
jgi:hypothetical protein